MCLHDPHEPEEGYINASFIGVSLTLYYKSMMIQVYVAMYFDNVTLKLC